MTVTVHHFNDMSTSEMYDLMACSLGWQGNPPLIDAATPRAVPEAAVVPCVSPAAMAQWLTILSADWAVRSVTK